jgi:hypothetical protein
MIYNNKNYYIDDRIVKINFACDLIKCKGACCTINGAIGAPITGPEINEINNIINIIINYVPDVNKKIISEEGFYKNIEGDLSLNNVNDRECVFAYYESGIAKCAFQKAFNDGETVFKKPISCELFPIRISGKNKDTLRYEKFYECDDALVKGKNENLTILEYVKDAVIRKFGYGFYEILVKNIYYEA